MPRKLKIAETGAPIEEQPKPQRTKGKAVFRSPSPGLKVIVKQSERIDHGAGSYTIVPPVIAEFDNRKSFGELKVDEEQAEALRKRAEERKARGLPPAYTEV